MPGGDPNSTAEGVMLSMLKGCVVAVAGAILVIGLIIGALVS